jgi:hypothetical protein
MKILFSAQADDTFTGIDENYVGKNFRFADLLIWLIQHLVAQNVASVEVTLKQKDESNFR